MADKIVFRYESMTRAANTIRDIATKYVTAAKTFQTDFESSTSAWEGESKEKMKSFIDGAVTEYLSQTVPNVLNALAQLLDTNIETMRNADQEIGAAIPQSLSQG